MPPPRPLPDKLFFRIGDVATIVDVKPHVLRYWESEFSGLRPLKTRGSHRQYRRRDVELAMLIKRLLHDEGYTIAGAKKRLRELGHGEDHTLQRRADRDVSTRAELLRLREELSDLLTTLDRIRAEAVDEDAHPHQVTIHASVQVPHRTGDRERGKR